MPALFYHVTRSPLEEVATTLLQRALAQGWRIEMRGQTPDRMAWYDQKLWLGAEEAFLPHGLAGGPHDDHQPVLLTHLRQGAQPPSGKAARQALLTVEGAEVSAAEATGLERVWILFDGHDAMALEQARAQWRQLTGAGAPAQYWSEETGRWEKKAER